MKNIVLIGFMGSGKSSIGRVLAKSLGFNFSDTDKLISFKENMSIPEIFRHYGEAGFRGLEHEVVKTEAAKTHQVIATGGGVVLREDNIAALKANGYIIYLKADPETIYSRVKHSKKRPLLNVDDPLAKIKELYGARSSLYEHSADHIVVTDDRPKGSVADEIVSWLKEKDF